MTNGEKLDQIFPDGICPFSKRWLDYEYKEPLTKINQDLTKNKSENPTSSTTKNDLGVDCISRQAVLEQAYAYGSGLEPDGYCVNVEDIQALPSVTPIRPKGHWIDIHEYHYYNDGDIETTELKCSCCNEVVEWDIELLHKPYFCENCGADMKEVEE
jgi:hypothetical protein